jgi:hypothetical protein
LRENLRRRKAQARGRAAGEAVPDGQASAGNASEAGQKND